jgi:hypothetical protein
MLRWFRAAITTPMRTLVDLLNDEKGYVRIFVDQGSFGYEKSAYASEGRSADLFDRMGGYASMDNAREAALLQLQAVSPAAKRRRKAKNAN